LENKRLEKELKNLIQSDTYALGRAEIYQIMKRLRDKDGRGVHDLDLHDLTTCPDRPALDVLPRLRVGAVPFAEYRNS
jgi:hypothetical protein